MRPASSRARGRSERRPARPHHAHSESTSDRDRPHPAATTAFTPAPSHAAGHERVSAL